MRERNKRTTWRAAARQPAQAEQAERANGSRRTGVLRRVAGVVCCTLIALATRPVPAAEPSAPTVTQPGAASSGAVAIRRTDYGIPHIEAGNWRDLGLGAGYAQASDNLCTLAELFATLRGTRSVYAELAAAPRADSILGRPSSVDSDFFFRLIMTPARLAAYRQAQRPELRDLVDGYARGYNRVVDEIQAGREPSRDRSCRDAAWLTHIDGDDVYRRMIEVSLAGGAARFIGALVHARPPHDRASAPDAAPLPASARAPATAGDSPALAGNEVDRNAADSDAAHVADDGTFEVGGQTGIGSNAIALSPTLTDTGHALLFGNPHWFWAGPDRFYQAQLTIAGTIDVAGAMFLGVPAVVIGYNAHVAWTHTVSSARRFGLFRLKLVAGEPSAYWFDGRREAMTRHTVSIEVRNAAGTLRTVSRDFYDSRLGMLVDLGSRSEKLKWSRDDAFAFDDANLDNLHTFDNYLGWAQAASLDQLIAVQRRYAAVPWANTLAIGAHEQRVWFGDVGPVPGVSDEQVRTCGVSIDDARWQQLAARVPLLDGSRSACLWQTAADSVQAGTLGLAQLPQRLTPRYAANMNDSYWLTDPAQPMRGSPAIVGPVGAVQSLRTRLGHRIVATRLSGDDGYPGHRFSVAILQRKVLDSTSLSATLFKRSLLDAVCPRHSIAVSHDPLTGAPLDAPRRIDIDAACQVLAQWHDDGNTEARGANLWDAFWSRIDRLPEAEIYTIPFDPHAPLTTPAQLNTASPRIVEAFGLSVAAALERGDPLDARRGERLYLADGDAHIPLYGGCAAAGYFTVACPSSNGIGVAPMGATAHGNSYMQIVGFDSNGVDAYTLLSTSESDDPASAHYRDASRIYAAKQWLRIPFDNAAIERAATADSVVLGP